MATQQAGLFAGLDETFTPLSQATDALQAAIAERSARAAHRHP